MNYNSPILERSVIMSPCPGCEKQTVCGCQSCIDRRGNPENMSIFNEDGESATCPFCKQSFSFDQWLEAEINEIYK